MSTPNRTRSGRRARSATAPAARALDAEKEAPASCPTCGAPPQKDDAPGYRRFTIAQPLGYRTDHRTQDYREWFEWSSPSSRARLAAGAELKQDAVKGAAVETGVTEVFEINDRYGSDFNFAPASDKDGWICIDLDDGVGPQLPPVNRSAAKKVALAAGKNTDVLVVGARAEVLPPGYSLAPVTAGRRGAWYSLGFILRGAASRFLDVQTGEIEVGLRSVTRDGTLTAQVFLSDSLANGAGDCTHLGNPGIFKQLLDEAASWASELETHPPHGTPATAPVTTASGTSATCSSTAFSTGASAATSSTSSGRSRSTSKSAGSRAARR